MNVSVQKLYTKDRRSGIVHRWKTVSVTLYKRVHVSSNVNMLSCFGFLTYGFVDWTPFEHESRFTTKHLDTRAQDVDTRERLLPFWNACIRLAFTHRMFQWKPWDKTRLHDWFYETFTTPILKNKAAVLCLEIQIHMLRFENSNYETYMIWKTENNSHPTQC